MTDDEREVRWPRPRKDPDEEPTEPWARPDAHSWEELLEEAKLRAADETTLPEP